MSQVTTNGAPPGPQKPRPSDASPVHAAAVNAELARAPSAVPPSDPERHWLEHVYQPHARQLTARAVLAGMLIGAVMCLSNLYVVLKTGWSLGVTITACILAYAVFAFLKSLRLVKSEFGPLENNAMGSVASAAGYMTGGGNMAALPALLILTGVRPDAWMMILWLGVIAALGVFAAIPIKRQLVNVERLPFPTGTATAETIRALHGDGEEGKAQGKLLGLAGMIGAFVSLLRGFKLIPPLFDLPFRIGGVAAGRWTWSLDLSLLLVAGGALMSFRTGWSMLLGAVLTFGFIVPWMVEQGAIQEVAFKGILQWTLWPGAGILVGSGLLSFLFQWRSVARALGAVTRLFGRGRGLDDEHPITAVEAPGWWFPVGFLLLGPIVVVLASSMFGIPWWVGALSLPLAVIMGFVAARVTGETDVTPTKALGPVTQMAYGAMLPGNVTANVMGANITGGVGLHAADLLVDLKSGFLLGANPRKQVFAQMFGVVAGAAVVIPAFNLLVPTADVLGSQAFPAPAAQVWAGVSKVLAQGLEALHPTARTGAFAGLVLGAIAATLERFAPPRIVRYVPSASGVGISMIMPAYNSIAFFLGASIAEWLRRKRPSLARRAVVPVSSGLLAGESLMGIFIAMLVALGFLAK